MSIYTTYGQVTQGVAIGSKSGYVELAPGFKWLQRYLITFSLMCKALKLGFNSLLQLLADTKPNISC